MISSALFINVAESMVIFAPPGQVAQSFDAAENSAVPAAEQLLEFRNSILIGQRHALRPHGVDLFGKLLDVVARSQTAHAKLVRKLRDDLQRVDTNRAGA